MTTSVITKMTARTSDLIRRRRPSARLSGDRRRRARQSRCRASAGYITGTSGQRQLDPHSIGTLSARFCCPLPCPHRQQLVQGDVRTCCSRIHSRASRSLAAVISEDSVPQISYQLCFDDPQVQFVFKFYTTDRPSNASCRYEESGSSSVKQSEPFLIAVLNGERSTTILTGSSCST